MITIIITAHNMEKYIEEALDSILAQTYKNYELILVDDGSTDETFNIMQTYQVKKPQQKEEPCCQKKKPVSQKPPESLLPEIRLCRWQKGSTYCFLMAMM